VIRIGGFIIHKTEQISRSDNYPSWKRDRRRCCRHF